MNSKNKKYQTKPEEWQKLFAHIISTKHLNDLFLNLWTVGKLFRRHNILFRPELALYHAVGCDKCFSDYKGRMGIYELLTASIPIKSAIANYQKM